MFDHNNLHDTSWRQCEFVYESYYSLWFESNLTAINTKSEHNIYDTMRLCDVHVTNRKTHTSVTVSSKS